MNGRAESLGPSEGTLGCAKSSLSCRQLKCPFLSQTASTLVVAESRIPGIYSCVASNKVGTAKRSINFYITGKSHAQRPPRQPGDFGPSL